MNLKKLSPMAQNAALSQKGVHPNIERSQPLPPFGFPFS